MRFVRLVLASLVSTAALSACSDDSGQTAEPTPTAPTTESARTGPADTSPVLPSTSPEEPIGPMVEVRISGDQVLPNAEEVSLGVGEPLVFDIESDRAGELHVHSKPEQYVEFDEGTTRAEITVETPGSVEVEDHETSAVVAILEVR